MKKDEICIIKIEDYTDEGMGIGHTVDGEAVFVKDTCIGDTVRVKIIKDKKHYCFGRMTEIISPSPDRQEPLCPVARPCGGCMLQQMKYEAQLTYKQKKVRNDLIRIGGMQEAEVLAAEEGICGMESPYRYRNKMTFPVGRDRDGKIITGFYAGRTHAIIPVEDCVTGHPVNRYITEACRKWMAEEGISPYSEENGSGTVRHIMTRMGFSTGELMVVLVVNREKDVRSRMASLISKLQEAVERYREEMSLKEQKSLEEDTGVKSGRGKSAEFPAAPVLSSVVVNVNPEKTNRILGRKTVCYFGKDRIGDCIGDVKFRISARSFFQVNPVQTRRLYGKVLEYADLHGRENVYDLYCGIGSISLFLAEKAGHVTGVEIVPEAIRDAKENAALNHISNAEFYTGKAEEVVPVLIRKGGAAARPDVVVVDPPRKGCDGELLAAIRQMAPEKLIYVSCNPATLARDLKLLGEAPDGYRLEKYSVYDQFAFSCHEEVCCLFRKK